MKEVGRSGEFNSIFKLCHFLDLICIDDEHEALLTRRQRHRIYDSLKLAVVDMAYNDGNICVYCHNGRSRFAAFVTGYMVMVCGYTPWSVCIWTHVRNTLKFPSKHVCCKRNR